MLEIFISSLAFVKFILVKTIGSCTVFDLADVCHFVGAFYNKVDL